MKIKPLAQPMLFIGIILVVLGLFSAATMVWGQYANSLPVSNDDTGFIYSLICISIPLLIVGGILIVFSSSIRKPKYSDKCLWHSWKGCKCTQCGLEDHNWDGCICLKCGEIRYKNSSELHVLNGCVCTKCKTAFHDLIWEYPLANSCAQELRCAKCGLVQENRILHAPQWVQSTSNACKQEQRCNRCSEILNEEIKHIYLPAEELKKNPCHHIEKCQRCGEIKENYEHDFDFSKRLSDYSTRDTNNWTDLYRCKVCGAEETRSDWAYTDW